MSSYDNQRSGSNWGVGMGYSGGAGQENRSYDSTGYSSYGDRDRNSTYGFSGDNRTGYGGYSSSAYGGHPSAANTQYRTETTTYTRDSDRDRTGYGSSDRYGSSGAYNTDRNTYGTSSNTGYGSSGLNTGYGSSGLTTGYGSGSSDRYNTDRTSGYGASAYNTGVSSSDRYGSNTGYSSSDRYNTPSLGTSAYGSGSQYGQDRDRRDYQTSSTMRYGGENVRDSDRNTSGSSYSHQPSQYSSNQYSSNQNSRNNDSGYQSSALSRYDDRTSRDRSDRSSSAYGGNYGSSYNTDRSTDRRGDNSNDEGFFASIGNWMSNLIGLTDKTSTGGSSRTIRPQIVEESGQKKVQYNFDVRGFAPEHVNLTASGQRIEVTATQEDKDDDHHVRREYRRVITVPEGIKVESFKSRVLQNGVLRVEAPIQVDQLSAEQQRSLLGEIPITKGSLTTGSTSSSNTSGTSGYTTGGKTTTTTEHVRETKANA